PRRPYSVLLPVGFTVPVPLPVPRWALTPPFHPDPARRRGGLLSVALSLGSPPPGVTRHRVSMEPGLSSPAAFRPLPERPSGRLAGGMWRPGRPRSTAIWENVAANPQLLAIIAWARPQFLRVQSLWRVALRPP